MSGNHLDHPSDAVIQFHLAFNVPIASSWSDPERRRLRRQLISEEFIEYLLAEGKDDRVEVLDAFADLVYVIAGAALEYGMDLKGAFEAVHQANMAKLSPDGQPILRHDGKILKPDGWQAPDLSNYV